MLKYSIVIVAMYLKISCAASEYFCSSHPQLIYNKIDRIILLNKRGNTLALYSEILSLLHLVLSDSKIPTAHMGKNYTTVSNAKRFIQQNFQKPIKLRHIAQSVHLSEIHFHNIFSQSLGMTPHQYLLHCRIENAKKLLWNTDISISEVAERSGLGCQQYLNKVFKKETGFTPAAYRKSCQKNHFL